MESLVPVIVNLIIGAVGGNAAGAALKAKSLGFLGNTLAGVVGGGVGGQFLTGVLGTVGATGMTGDVASAGVGGALALAAFAYAKPYIAKYIPAINKLG
jgi:uncharacterized membrane protein YeaQ/YmgE (transglycosylase-associated protein family)